MKALQKKVAELTAKLGESEADDLIEVALSDGRLLPAQEGWARDLGKSNFAALKTYIESAQPLAALSSTQPRRTSHAAPPPAALDEATLAVCRQFGNDPAKVQAQLAALNAQP